MKYIVIGYLLISSFLDIRSKKLPTVWVLGGLLIMGIYSMFSLLLGKREWVDLLGTLLPGISILLLSKISNQIGSGDGLLFLFTGLYFSVREQWTMVFLSFFLAAAGSICLLLGKRSCKNRRIPFVPYIGAAAIVVLFIY